MRNGNIAQQERNQPKSTHIPSLDGIRFLAIMVVFIGHAHLPQILLDTSGVTIFFFLSGYLITTLLIGEHGRTGHISLRAFYWRRTLRIFPPLYLILAVSILLNISGVLTGSVRLEPVMASALHLTNYQIVLHGRSGLPSSMYALWSLAVEEHFYLLFPLLIVIMLRTTASRRTIIAVLATICLVILFWRSWLVLHESATFDRVYLATDTRADSILVGCIFSLVWQGRIDSHKSRFSRPAWHWVILPVATAAFYAVQRAPASFSMSVGYTLEGLLLMPIFFALIVWPDSWAGRALNWQPVAYLGVLSYSIYLIHRPALLLIEQHLHTNRWFDAGFALGLTVLAAAVTHRFIELPAARLRRSWSRTPSSGAPADRALPAGIAVHAANGPRDVERQEDCRGSAHDLGELEKAQDALK